MSKWLIVMAIITAIFGFIGLLMASAIEETPLYQEAIGVLLTSIACSLAAIAYDKGS